MRATEWFGVAIRVLGVWVLIGAIDDLRTILDIRLGFFAPQQTPFAFYSVKAIIHVTVGAYLLFGAAHLTHLVYGRSERGFEVIAAKPPEQEERPPI